MSLLLCDRTERGRGERAHHARTPSDRAARGGFGEPFVGLLCRFYVPVRARASIRESSDSRASDGRARDERNMEPARWAVLRVPSMVDQIQPRFRKNTTKEVTVTIITSQATG